MTKEFLFQLIQAVLCSQFDPWWRSVFFFGFYLLSEEYKFSRIISTLNQNWQNVLEIFTLQLMLQYMKISKFFTKKKKYFIAIFLWFEEKKDSFYPKPLIFLRILIHDRVVPDIRPDIRYLAKPVDPQYWIQECEQINIRIRCICSDQGIYL